jgi:hypothetical protein
MAYIRDYYKVPAKRGIRIAFTWQGTRMGTVVGSADQYLRVRFDDNPKLVETLHPTWEVQYLPNSPSTFKAGAQARCPKCNVFAAISKTGEIVCVHCIRDNYFNDYAED